MSESDFREKKVKAAGEKRILNVRQDPPDIRDRWYEPALVRLKDAIDQETGTTILNQGQEGACTGFACAAVINQLNMLRGGEFRASPRMLYEMARRHDEWPGESYDGSSCRGVIRGWKNMGVCSDDQWPYDTDDPGELTIERAIHARKSPLGAYYRLRPDVVEYHAALNEVGALLVSAKVHSGWWDPQIRDPEHTMATILSSEDYEGGHAFAIVGYNERGFIVQNSWGPDWGTGGFAVWLYEDWISSVIDGWVFRLGLSTPQIFGMTASSAPGTDAEFGRRAPKRMEIAGHFAHFDDGKFEEHGDYWTCADDIARTAELIKSKGDKYRHLLIYAHGGLNSPNASAKRIAALKEGFKRNGVYPFHVMYDTGLAEEIKDAVSRAFTSAESRAEGFFGRMRDKIVEQTDRILEDVVRKPVTPLWDEMKLDARLPFESGADGIVGDGVRAMGILALALKESGLKIHLAGHSTGGVLIGHLLKAFDEAEWKSLVSSCTLFAPACTIDFYHEHYAPRLGKKATGARLPRLDIYNLSERAELRDNVAKLYRKSLLYLVSRALERDKDKPLLGMRLYSKELEPRAGLNLIYSDGRGKVTRSKTHGGFDNDEYTLNSMLTTILGKAPAEPFRAEEMTGY
jgi:hypothetical protein